MDAYCMEVRKLEKKFHGLEFHDVERDHNVAANILSKMGSTRAQVPCRIFINELSKPSISEPASSDNTAIGQEVMVVDIPWTHPLID